MIIEKKSLNTHFEKEAKVLSYMIMDNDVCDACYRRYVAGELKSNYFTNDNKKIFQWVIKYYAKTGRQPAHGIQQIWEHKKRGKQFGSKSARDVMEKNLSSLSDLYDIFEDEGTNTKDVILFDLPNFIRICELSLRIEKAQDLLAHDEVEKASKVFSGWTDIDSDEIEDENMGIILPFSQRDVEESAIAGNLNSEVVYEFEGDLGRLIGPLRRSWLVAVTAVEKGGKSFLLDEIGYDAALYQGRKVLKINLELSESLQRMRMQKRISRTVDPHKAGRMIYPILDCENNQFGTCRIPKMARKFKRRGHHLIENPGANYSYINNRGWNSCTECLNNPKIRSNAHKTKRFLPTIWFDSSRLKALHPSIVKKTIRQYREKALANFRVKCFPRFSRTFEEIKNYIYRYIEKHQWVPEIILLDYLDITANSGKSSDDNMRHEVDRKWKQASQLAGELNCLVINADQANKASRTQYQLDQLSTSESKTKDAHLDLRIALNQMDHEKKLGIARIGVLFHRHQEFAISNEVLITQRLATSQPILENVRIWEKEKKYRVSQEN